MNETICIVEMVRVGFVCCFFLEKKVDISDEFSEATGIYQKCLSNIHTEFLANDWKFLKNFYNW